MPVENSNVLEAGEYWIGDLCYVMHEVWSEVCTLLYKPDIDGTYTLKNGVKFGVLKTGYGDGCYNSNVNFNFWVDAGLIGAIKLSDIDKNNSANIIKYGYTTTIDSEFSPKSKNGTLIFNNIEIYTSSDIYCED